MWLLESLTVLNPISYFITDLTTAFALIDQYKDRKWTMKYVQVYQKPEKAQGKKDPSQGLPEPLSR